MSEFDLTWNGCIPVRVHAPTLEEAKEQFATDAAQEGISVEPADVEEADMEAVR